MLFPAVHNILCDGTCLWCHLVAQLQWEGVRIKGIIALESLYRDAISVKDS